MRYEQNYQITVTFKKMLEKTHYCKEKQKNIFNFVKLQNQGQYMLTNLISSIMKT